MRLHFILLLTLWIVVTLPELLFADDWPVSRTEEVFSESREYFVRIIPGNRMGKNAKAELYHWQKDKSYRLMKEITLVNREAPVKFYVSNRGYWVTIDNWHSMGFGKVVVFYDFNGRRLKSYELADLFDEKEIESFPHSTSSISWQKEPTYIDTNQKILHLEVKGGGTFLFRFDTWSYHLCKYHGKIFLCRSKNRNRKWIPFKPKWLDP